MKAQVIQGNNVDVLRTFPDNHFDSVVTDPPYGIDFLGKAWDANTGALETYQECLRVLKPGGHIIAFSAARTYHHLAVTVEQAGFEIRDQIMWIYSSGFPKSQDVGRSIQRSLGVKEKKTIPRTNGKSTTGELTFGESPAEYDPTYDITVVTDPEAKAWEGWGTQLKPAHEPCVLARKPLDKGNSIARNCQQWGVGALNIAATRVPWGEDDDPEAYIEWMKKYPASTGSKSVFDNAHAAAKGVDYVKDQEAEINPDRNVEDRMAGRFPSNVIGDIPNYQKYFYCPKVSRAERHIGHETPPPMFGDMKGAYDENGERYAVGLDSRTDANKGNNHPTVKPIELMKYLIKLVTPPGGHVLDPFCGSGSTGCAAVELDREFTGCELDPAYVAIAQTRIKAWYEHTHSTTFNEIFEIEP